MAATVSETLLAWYDRHARDLPWRARPGAAPPDPYRVWLSEVMLQQTTVAAVKPYFAAFTARWPDVEALAAAPEDDVMAAWAGLGYYSRARNLVKCARAVAERGGFPATEADLRELPGLGAYTAAAVAAIAFGRRAVVVDANVERVVALGPTRLVITGGEPLLQQWELAPLVTSLGRRGYFCEVETNGTIAPLPELVRDIDQWNVSPKLANSGNPADRREDASALTAFRELPNAYFKFVVNAAGDVEEVCALRGRHNLPNQRIILMPQGQTPEALKLRSGWVSEACVKEGFRFSTRLHILLWGDERGR